MRLKLFGGEGWTLAILCLVFIALFAYPLGFLAKVAFNGGLTPFFDALNTRSVPRAFYNSLESALLSSILALIIGTAAALALGLTDMRAKGVFTFLLLIPMMIPPHVTAIAWVQALGPSSPLLQSLGIAPEIGTTHPLYSREGVVLLLGIQHAPLVSLSFSQPYEACRVICQRRQG